MKMQFTPIMGLAKTSITRIIIPLYLALTSLSAWAVIPMTGQSSAQGTRMGDRVSYTQQLPVGPAPRNAKGGTNLDDLGLCGVLGLAGVFSDNKTLARIIVQSNGYYGLSVNWADSNHNPPIIYWSCVRLTDFTGLPRPMDFGSSGPYSFTVTGRHFETSNLGETASACIWTGMEGAFSEAPHDSLFVGGGLKGSIAHPDDNELAVISAADITLSTYAFCSTFGVKGFSWKYYPSTPLGGSQCSLGSVFEPLPCIATTTPGPVGTGEYWCTIGGIFGQGPPFGQGAGVVPMLDLLSIGPDPTTGASVYKGTVLNSDALAWNCLRFRQ